MNILKLVEQDHRELRCLVKHLELISKARNSFKKAYLVRLCRFLEAHLRTEEEVIHIPLQTVRLIRHQILEDLEKHRITRLLVGELLSIPIEHESWQAKLAVLKDSLLRHATNEEGTLLDLLERSLVPEEYESLGRKYYFRKKDILNHLESSGPAVETMRGIA